MVNQRYYGIYFTDIEHPNGAWLTKNDGEIYYYPNIDIASAHIHNMKNKTDSWEESISDLCEAREFAIYEDRKINFEGKPFLVRKRYIRACSDGLLYESDKSDAPTEDWTQCYIKAIVINE